MTEQLQSHKTDAHRGEQFHFWLAVGLRDGLRQFAEYYGYSASTILRMIVRWLVIPHAEMPPFLVDRLRQKQPSANTHQEPKS